MHEGNFSTSTQERYLEDFVEGAVHEFGPISLAFSSFLEY